MTKAELIRKISKRAGVPDSEAKIFFEIFLKKSSEILSPGEAVFLKGFGHFQLRKGKIKAKLSVKNAASGDAVYVDLMVYYPSKSLEEEFKQNLIFNVPTVQIENAYSIDSHFSLSIGKPVIPLKGVKSSDFFIPLTGMELRKLVEAKVDKILKEIEVVKEYTKGNEVLVIDAESFKSHQLEFNWGEVPSKNIVGSKLSGIQEKKDTKEINGTGIAWDFGYDLSKEIEEESILDIDKDAEIPLSDDRNIGWDFGVTFIDDETEQPDKLPEEKKADTLANVNESGEEKNVFQKYDELTKEESDFEKVRPISSTILNLNEIEEDDNDKMTEEKSEWNFGNPKTVAFNEFEPDTEINELDEVETESIKEDNRTIHFDNIPEPNELPNSDSFLQDGISITETKENEIETIEDKAPKTSSVVERRLEREERFARKGVSATFVIAILVIIAVAVILYIYLNNEFKIKSPDSIQKFPKKDSAASIIERDFSIPVSYPYSKDLSGTNSAAESINPEALKSNTKKNTDAENKSTVKGISENKKPTQPVIKTDSPKEEKNNSISRVPPKTGKDESVNKNDESEISFDNLPPPVDVEQIRKNIIPVGSTFTVQVSSWQNKSIAQDQVIRFVKKGYDAFMEQADIPGKGTWYRVKIKNFKSMKEAEDFLISNQ